MERFALDSSKEKKTGKINLHPHCTTKTAYCKAGKEIKVCVKSQGYLGTKAWLC